MLNMQETSDTCMSSILPTAQWVHKEKNTLNWHDSLGSHSRKTYSSSTISSKRLAEDRYYINLRDSWYCNVAWCNA